MSTTIKAAGGLIFNDKKELLFIFRKGKWDLPKGKLDEGETLEACALREIKEETGVTAHIVRLIGTTEHRYFEKREEVLKQTWWYMMEAQPPIRIEVQEEEGIEKAMWVNKDAIASYLSNTYPNIVDIIKRSGYLR